MAPHDGAASGGESAKPAAETSEGSGSTFNVWPWVTLGAGVVVTGVGAAFYALGANDHAQVTDAAGYGDPSVVYPMTRAEAQAYVDSGNTKKLVGGISLGLGGALIATGVVLLFTGKSDTPPETASFTLAPSTDGVLAGYSGRF